MAGVYGVMAYVVSQRSSEIYYFFFGSLNARSTMSFESVDTG